MPCFISYGYPILLISYFTNWFAINYGASHFGLIIYDEADGYPHILHICLLRE